MSKGKAISGAAQLLRYERCSDSAAARGMEPSHDDGVRLEIEVVMTSSTAAR